MVAEKVLRCKIKKIKYFRKKQYGKRGGVPTDLQAEDKPQHVSSLRVANGMSSSEIFTSPALSLSQSNTPSHTYAHVPYTCVLIMK